MAAAYLAHASSRYTRGEEYGQKSICSYGLQNCTIAEQIICILRQIDRFLLTDKLTGFVNWPSVEFMCLKAYGIELAFARCKVQSDWLRPLTAGKDWVSKVDWTAADKVDPYANNAAPSTEFKLEALDNEVKTGTDHEALMAKSAAALKLLQSAPIDLINDIRN